MKKSLISLNVISLLGSTWNFLCFASPLIQFASSLIRCILYHRKGVGHHFIYMYSGMLVIENKSFILSAILAILSKNVALYQVCNCRALSQ